MIPVGTHGLDCPDEQDYAALALYMQCFADTVDASLQTQLDLAQGFADQPTIICFNLANKSVAASSTAFDVFNAETFNNSTFMSLVIDPIGVAPLFLPRNYIRIGSAPGVTPAVPYPRGMYMIGGYTAQTAAGALTAYSQRTLAITVSDETLPSTDQLLFFVDDVTFETSTAGNERQIVKFPIELTGESGVIVETYSQNTNAASAVNVLANSFFWVTYVGPSDLVEVS